MFAASGWPKMPKTPHSSLNLSSMSGHCSLHATRDAFEVRSIAVAHDALGLVDRHVDDDARRRPRSAARLPPVSPMTRAGTPRRRRPLPAPRRRSSAVAETTTRDADSPNSAAASLSRGVARHVDARRSTTSAPMPPVSKQHSASVTARPPSEQSCADRMSRSSRQRRPAAAAARARASRSSAGGTPRTRPCTTFRYSLPPSSPRPSPSRMTTSPVRWKRRAEHAIGVLEQPDDADAPASGRSPGRRSRCRG